jgi:hypothetical protein
VSINRRILREALAAATVCKTLAGGAQNRRTRNSRKLSHVQAKQPPRPENLMSLGSILNMARTAMTRRKPLSDCVRHQQRDHGEPIPPAR